MRRLKRLAAALILLAAPVQARDVVDMSGRTVTVPERITRVYGAFTSSVAIMAAMAPERLVGTYAAHTPQLDRFLPPVMAGLPLMEANAVQTMDLEKVLGARIDMALSLSNPGLPDQVRDSLALIGKPAVAVNVERLEQYPATFRFLGHLLDLQERGESLARYIEEAQRRMAAAIAVIPQAERPRLFYAESPDGLQSQCDSAFRAEAIALAGAVNVLHCPSGPGQLSAVRTVTPEVLLSLKPEVILVRFPQTGEMFLSDPRWATLPAVRDRRVHLIPSLPFNWIDRPPSYMRVMGMQWLAQRLHPQRAIVDIEAETRLFFALFFGLALDDADLADLLGGNGE
jgi:ABC-type Fe3+-hydroxamate transport system, periplasmic component